MPAKTAPKKAVKVPTPKGLVTRFNEWLSTRDSAAVVVEHQTELKNEITAGIEAHGNEDDKGSIWFDLEEPVSFADHTGKTKVYASLKFERYLSPAQPTPDPEKAEALLRKKGLWLDEEQEKALNALRSACPYAIISVDVDVNAVADAYFRRVFTVKQYEGTLIEQKENFRFVQTEVK